MLAYLSGPIEYAEDGGKLWRRKLAPYLREQLGHRVYDPAEDEKKNLSDEEAAHFREWKSSDVERFRRVDHMTLQDDITVEDPKAFTKPWNTHVIFVLRPGWEILEYSCADNANFDENLRMQDQSK